MGVTGRFSGRCESQSAARCREAHAPGVPAHPLSGRLRACRLARGVRHHHWVRHHWGDVACEPERGGGCEAAGGAVAGVFVAGPGDGLPSEQRPRRTGMGSNTSVGARLPSGYRVPAGRHFPRRGRRSVRGQVPCAWYGGRTWFIPGTTCLMLAGMKGGRYRSHGEVRKSGASQKRLTPAHHHIQIHRGQIVPPPTSSA